MSEQKLVVILTLENQFEANRMKTMLEERNIPFIIKEHNDLEYGNIKGKRGWGRLESYEEFGPHILKLYKEGFDQDPIEEEINGTPLIPQNKKRNIKEITIFILLIAIIYLGYQVYALNKIIERPSHDKNFNHVHGRYFFLMQWKGSGQNYYLGEDGSGNGTFNKHSFYDPKGRLAYIGFDENEDGIREKNIGIGLNKDTLNITYDRNNDGITDKYSFGLNKKNWLTLSDIDFDRKLDSVSVNDKVYSIEQFIQKLK